eukprot:g588.t1
MPKKWAGENTAGAKAKAQKKAAQAEKDKLRKERLEKKEAASWQVGANLRGQRKAADAQLKTSMAMAQKEAKKALLLAEEQELNALIKKSGKKIKTNKKKSKEAAIALFGGDDSAAKKKLKKKKQKQKQKKEKTKTETSKVKKMKANGDGDGNDRDDGEDSLAMGILPQVIDGKQLKRSDSSSVSQAAADDGGWLTLNDAVGSLTKKEKEDIVQTGDTSVSSEAALAEKKSGRPNFRALFEAFKAREMPRLREENPGLKKSQYDERLSKLWAKAPENPFSRKQKR